MDMCVVNSAAVNARVQVLLMVYAFLPSGMCLGGTAESDHRSMLTRAAATLFPTVVTPIL